MDGWALTSESLLYQPQPTDLSPCSLNITSREPESFLQNLGSPQRKLNSPCPHKHTPSHELR